MTDMPLGDRAGRENPPMPPTPSTESLRLTYHYDGDAIRLTSQDRVDVVVPFAEASLAAHFVDVQSTDGTELARVPVRADLTGTIEVFGLPGEPIIRVPNPNPNGAFSVIVPLPQNAARVLLKRLDAPSTTSTSSGANNAVLRAEPIVLADDEIEW